jgi:hypothetical protein
MAYPFFFSASQFRSDDELSDSAELLALAEDSGLTRVP